MITVRCAVKTDAGSVETATVTNKLLNWKKASPTEDTRNGSKGKGQTMSRVPLIDLYECTDCEACLELCSDVFKRNIETDIIEVVELSEYPEDEIETAIGMCPCDCITWEDTP